MTRSFFLSLVLGITFCLFISQSAQAQYTTGISAITYDQYSQMIFTYSATDIDYYTEFYYDVSVLAFIFNGPVIANGQNNDPDGDGIAEVNLQVSVQYNQSYLLISNHYVSAYYQVYYPDLAYWDPLWL